MVVGAGERERRLVYKLGVVEGKGAGGWVGECPDVVAELGGKEGEEVEGRTTCFKIE